MIHRHLLTSVFVVFGVGSAALRAQPEEPQTAMQFAAAAQDLAKQLASADEAVRIAAAGRFTNLIQSAQREGHVSDVASIAVPALIHALEDSVPGVRKDSAYALGDLGRSAIKAVPKLREKLKAIIELGQTNPKKAAMKVRESAELRAYYEAWKKISPSDRDLPDLGS